MRIPKIGPIAAVLGLSVAAVTTSCGPSVGLTDVASAKAGGSVSTVDLSQQPVRRLSTSFARSIDEPPRTLPAKWVDLAGRLQLPITESGRYEWRTPSLPTLDITTVESVTVGIELDASMGRIVDSEIQLIDTPDGTGASVSFTAIVVKSPAIVMLNRVTAVLR